MIALDVQSTVRSLFLWGAMGSACVCTAQNWQLSEELVIGDFDNGARMALALDGDLVAIAISSPSGGLVEVRQRNEGGLGQWGVFFSTSEPTPWFGWSLALHNGRLTIGSPRTNGSQGLAVGIVRMYHLDPGNALTPVEDLGTLAPEISAAGDLFGYAQCWSGDTLVISAAGRSLFRATGTVFQFGLQEGGFQQVGQLSPTPLVSQLPFIRWFGASLASAGGQLAIAAPFSGFQEDNAGQQIGSVHLYARDASAPDGWSIDSVLYDIGSHPDGPCAYPFARIELGRSGMAFVEGRLILDHSASYTGDPSSSFDPWQVHLSSNGDCPECGLRILPAQAPWDLAGAGSPDMDPMNFTRSFAGWSGSEHGLLLERWDPVNSTWSTAVYRRDEGGPENWGNTSSLPELDPCDELRGPVAAAGDLLVRTALRTAPECGVEEGLMQVRLHIFQAE